MSQTGAVTFSVDVDQFLPLPPGGRVVSAVVTVTAPETLVERGGGAEVIIADCSAPARDMIADVRRAVAAATDAISDGTAFAIVAGTGDGQQAYPAQVHPAHGGLAVASAETRAAARAAAASLPTGGNAELGQWLRLARDLLRPFPGRLRHATLAVGSPNGEDPEELDAAIASCAGVFRCDCRGVGTNWQVAELRKVASALLGTVDLVMDPGDLAADLVAMMRDAMGKHVAEVSLRVRTPQSATVRMVKQVAPHYQELTAAPRHAGLRFADYPAGAWSAGESRDYLLSIEVAPPPVAVTPKSLAARVQVITMPDAGAHVLGEGLIKASWDSSP